MRCRRLNLFAALAQLLHHVVEVAAEVSDFVVAAGKADGDVQVAVADLRDLFLQFDHRTLDQVGEGDRGALPQMATAPAPATIRTAWRSGSRKETVASDEEQQPAQQDERDRQQRFDLPVDANRTQVESLRCTAPEVRWRLPLAGTPEGMP